MQEKLDDPLGIYLHNVLSLHTKKQEISYIIIHRSNLTHLL